MLTFSDMRGRGGLTNDDVSKKGNFSAIANMCMLIDVHLIAPATYIIEFADF